MLNALCCQCNQYSKLSMQSMLHAINALCSMIYVQYPLSCQPERNRGRKTALGPSDFLELLQGSQHLRKEMKPLLLVKEICLPPWYGRDKRCLEVMILVSDQRVDPPRKILSRKSTLLTELKYKSFIQLPFHTRCTWGEFGPDRIGKSRKFFSRMLRAFQLTN